MVRKTSVPRRVLRAGPRFTHLRSSKAAPVVRTWRNRRTKPFDWTSFLAKPLVSKAPPLITVIHQMVSDLA